MTLDGLSLSCIVNEIQFLIGAKIEKVYQPEKHEIVLLLHSKQGKKRLVLSANASDCCVRLTDFSKENPSSAPPFCMLLRKRVSSGRITKIDQRGFDRIVSIDIEARDEMGAMCCFAIIVEIMGKHSNIMLVDDNNRVVDCIKRVSFDVSSVRQVFPGMEYSLPPTSNYNPLELSDRTLAEIIFKNAQPPKQALISKIQGMSSQTAEEILYRCFGDRDIKLTEERAEIIASEVKRFYTTALNSPEPRLYKNMDGLPVFYAALPYAAYSGGKELCFNTMNETIDAYFRIRIEMNKFRQTRDKLLKTVKKDIVRLQKKIKIQLETIDAADKSEDIRKKGELITANIYKIRRGASSFEAEDYYTGKMVTISLDPTIPPASNAAKCFKKYNKLKNARGIAKEQYEKYSAELKYLEEEEYNISSATNIDELAQVRYALIKAGYIEQDIKAKKEQQPKQSEPLKFIASDGTEILVGRNSRQNDRLTLKTARPDDVWLHAKDMPGSHVIICCGDKEPSDSTLLYAASLAAAYSKGRFSGKVPVDYTQVKNVKKPNGAKAGMVIYDKYSTIMAVPEKLDNNG